MKKTFFIQSKRYVSFEESKMLKILNNIQAGIESKDTQSSRWRIDSIGENFLTVLVISLSKGSCYVDFSDFITRKSAVLNIHNSTDHKCLLFSILAETFFNVLLPTCKENPNSYSMHINKLDTSTLRFPQKLVSRTLKFKKANNLIVNVYTCEDKIILPVRVSSLIDQIHSQFLQSSKDLAITNKNIGSFTDSLIGQNCDDRFVNHKIFSLLF